MTPQVCLKLLLRDLDTLRAEVEAYADDATLWKVAPGIANSGGNLALHMLGNLQHFFGTVLGGTDYVRRRDDEFDKKNVPRADILGEIETTKAVLETTLSGMTEERLDAPFPVEIAGHRPSTRGFVIHLCSHLTYHLGQLDYHRRILTGEKGSVSALSVKSLP